MIVNLSNIDTVSVDSITGKPNDFEHAIEMALSRKSYEDSGIVGFKEITDMNWISFGHFIIIEKIMTMDVSDSKRLRALAPYLIRPEKEKFLDNDNKIKEDVHIAKVEQIPIGAIYGSFNRFIPLRNKYLYETYNGVIYGTLTEDDDSSDSEDDDDEGTDINSGMGAREGYERKWFWYNLIGAVADGNIFRRQAAVELPMYEVMPFLAERRHKQIVENLEAKARR